MLFSDITFLYYFLPAVLLLYLAAPRKCKNAVLLVSSLIFYGWGEPRYMFLMMASIILAYIGGILIEKAGHTKKGRVIMAISVAISLSFLLIFKYADFFVSNFNAVTGLSVPLLRLALPIGISFYTFQIISYTVDVYRQSVAAQKNIISFGAYVSLFPQLIAGPIVRYRDIAEALNNRTHSFDQIAYGIRRFVLGLGKKVLIANLMGEFCNAFRAANEPSLVFSWFYALALLLQTYFDFSGYSDMAIGLGSIFGFHFPENFEYPLISRSITEFWRRWHVSLGTWFRDYVYIPLGGNRKGRAAHIRNIMIVWLLTGFWHGAAWNFVLWGLVFALLLLLEKFFLGQWLSRLPALISYIYVGLVLLFSFVLFHGESMAQVGLDIQGMLGLTQLPLMSAETIYYLSSYLVLFIVALIGATPLPALMFRKIDGSKLGARIMPIVEVLGLLALTIWVTGCLVDGSFNPFLYFRF